MMNLNHGYQTSFFKVKKKKKKKKRKATVGHDDEGFINLCNFASFCYWLEN
jgi:hypothetical protein